MFFLQKSPEHISKTFLFLSLKCSAYLRRSRLVPGFCSVLFFSLQRSLIFGILFLPKESYGVILALFISVDAPMSGILITIQCTF